MQAVGITRHFLRLIALLLLFGLALALGLRVLFAISYPLMMLVVLLTPPAVYLLVIIAGLFGTLIHRWRRRPPPFSSIRTRPYYPRNDGGDGGLSGVREPRRPLNPLQSARRSMLLEDEPPDR